MKESKITRRALLGSVISIVLCTAMLVGATFAWFTDTASTGVNKVESGTLKIELQDEAGNSLEGKFLEWQKAAGHENEAVLWEPGATYKLQPIKIVNTGKLALKYKITITGIQGSSKLNDVITWTYVDDTGAAVALGSERSLAVGATDTLTIQGTMDTTAGNDYQDKSIDGISITVTATQDNVEADSYGTDYDKFADGTPDNPSYSDNVSVSVPVAAEGDTTVTDNEAAPTVTVDIPANSIGDDVTKLTLIKKATTTPSTVTVTDGYTSSSYEISLTDQNGAAVTAQNGFFTVDLQIKKGMSISFFKHYNTALTAVATKDALTEIDKFYYDATTGILTFTTDDFSPFTVEYKYAGGLGTEDSPYLIATADQLCQIKNNAGYFKLVADIITSKEIYTSGKTWTIDLNGHSVTLNYNEGDKPNNGSVFYIAGKNGNLSIIDSSEAQTGSVYGMTGSYTNKVYSAVRAGNYGTLNIYGGHFYGRGSTGDACIFTMTGILSSTKATVNIYGGTFESATALNGTYYVLNHQDNASAGCVMNVYGGSFVNYNPGVTEVDPVNAKTGTIVLGAGCTTTEKTSGGNTIYTVTQAAQ